jgi:uncharacterized membrane protein
MLAHTSSNFNPRSASHTKKPLTAAVAVVAIAVVAAVVVAIVAMMVAVATITPTGIEMAAASGAGKPI